jgi:hypothetical protein
MVRLQLMSLQPHRRRLTTHPGSCTDRRNSVTGTQPLRTPVAVVNARLHDSDNPDTTRSTTLASYHTHDTTN